jgi:hypothetical protein
VYSWLKGSSLTAITGETGTSLTLDGNLGEEIAFWVREEVSSGVFAGGYIEGTPRITAYKLELDSGRVGNGGTGTTGTAYFFDAVTYGEAYGTGGTVDIAFDVTPASTGTMITHIGTTWTTSATSPFGYSLNPDDAVNGIITVNVTWEWVD